MNTWFIMLAAVWLSVPSAPVVDPVWAHLSKPQR